MGGGMGGGMAPSMGSGSMGGGMGGSGAPAPAQNNVAPARAPVHIGDVGVDMRQKGKSVMIGSAKDDLDFSGDELDDDLLPGM